MNVAEALLAAKGARVDGLIATVERTFPVERGASAKGPWVRMDLEIRDSTGTIRVAWWSPTTEDSGSLVGRVISITCNPNDKRPSSVVDHYLDRQGGVVVKIMARGPGLQVSGPAGEYQPQPQLPLTSNPGTGGATLPGKMPLSAVLSVVDKVATRAAQALGAHADGQSVGAICNTITIALTQGRIVDDLPDDLMV